MALATKNVLVCFGENKRPVSFSASSDVATERKELEGVIFAKFQDVLEDSPQPSTSSRCSLLLQLKSEGWSGEFVDLSEDALIPDSSVIRAVCLQAKVQNTPPIMHMFMFS